LGVVIIGSLKESITEKIIIPVALAIGKKTNVEKIPDIYKQYYATTLELVVYNKLPKEMKKLLAADLKYGENDCCLVSAVKVEKDKQGLYLKRRQFFMNATQAKELGMLVDEEDHTSKRVLTYQKHSKLITGDPLRITTLGQYTADWAPLRPRVQNVDVLPYDKRNAKYVNRLLKGHYRIKDKMDLFFQMKPGLR